MNTYYEIKGTVDGEEEILFGSFDKSDCTYELESEKEGWKSEGYKKIKIVSREEAAEPDTEVYGEDFVALVKAESEGYEVGGELGELYLAMDRANKAMLLATRGMSPMDSVDDSSYKDAKLAYRAYWDAVDGQ